jgi:hypothetical protein
MGGVWTQTMDAERDKGVRSREEIRCHQWELDSEREWERAVMKRKKNKL